MLPTLPPLLKPLLSALFKAFTNSEKQQVSEYNIHEFGKYHRQLKRCRNNFFSADSLERFSRDYLPQDSFKDLKGHCLEVVIDSVEMLIDSIGIHTRC